MIADFRGDVHERQEEAQAFREACLRVLLSSQIFPFSRTFSTAGKAAGQQPFRRR